MLLANNMHKIKGFCISDTYTCEEKAKEELRKWNELRRANLPKPDFANGQNAVTL